MAKKKKSGALTLLTESRLKAKYPTYQTGSVIEVDAKGSLRLPFRVITLNYQLNGGIQYGKILELFGEESTGKSLLAMDAAYCAQALGGEVIWVDAENSFNAAWFKNNGIDLSRIHVLSSNAIELISDWVKDMIVMLRSKLTKNQPILLVMDSIAAARCMAEINEDMMDASAKFGNRAKAISDFLGNRNSLFKDAGVAVILINQLRRKIGASKFEDPDKTVGGDALKFYAHQRVDVRKGKQIKKKIKGVEYKVGHNAYTRTKKDKTGPPRATSEHEVYFRVTTTNDLGFAKYTKLAELLVQLQVLQRAKGSSRYYYDGKMLANGEDAMSQVLLENQDLRSTLIKASKINTISRTQRKIDKLTTNLYRL